MDIDNLTIREVKEIIALFGEKDVIAPSKEKHLMIGRRCLVRTYSAGIHIGDVTFAGDMECKLVNALRLWKWENGGLSLSSVARNGIKGGRVNVTGEVYLTNVIEMIPTTAEAEATYVQFIED